MNQNQNVDSCISVLKGILGDPSNELSSEQQRKLKASIRRLKQLHSQHLPSSEEIRTVVEEVSRLLCEALIIAASE